LTIGDYLSIFLTVFSKTGQNRVSRGIFRPYATRREIKAGETEQDIMKIQVGGLSEGHYEYDFTADPSELELGERFSEPVRVQVNVEKTPTQMYLTALIGASGGFQCDRCLKGFQQSLSPRYQMYYLYEEPEGLNLDPMEVQIVPHGTSVIDISDDVRQTILLSIPLKLLCKEDCKGLCPHCGKDRNIEECSCGSTVTDPRWEKLRGLRREHIRN
jgi:DUF177 domain-containing protein